MTKKKASKKSTSVSPKRAHVALDQIDERKKLLAQVAAAVVPGLLSDPSETTSTPSGLAEIAIDIAEAILNQAGIPGPASVVEASAANGAA